MPIPLFQVDAFTDRPFGGNPAGVCLLDSPMPDDWMQSVAAEVNVAETAFLWPRGSDLQLRWFTPAVEVDLCGHATLATAHVLWEEGRLAHDAVASFHTKSGCLKAARRSGSEIEMDFPSDPPRPLDPPAGLDEMLGARAVSVSRGKFDVLVELESEAAVRAVAPDLTRVRTIPARGVIVTARSSGNVDFVSRFFAPQSGVDEDPVTGSAHCCLAPFWGSRLGKESMTGHQASKRGGTVRVRLAGDRVLLGGQAVTVFRGTLGA